MEPHELAAVSTDLEDFVGRVFASLPGVDQRTKGGPYLQGRMLA